MTNSLTDEELRAAIGKRLDQCDSHDIATLQRMSEAAHRKAAALPCLEPQCDERAWSRKARAPEGWWFAVLVFGIITIGGVWALFIGVEQLSGLIRAAAALLAGWL